MSSYSSDGFVRFDGDVKILKKLHNQNADFLRNYTGFTNFVFKVTKVLQIV